MASLRKRAAWPAERREGFWYFYAGHDALFSQRVVTSGGRAFSASGRCAYGYTNIAPCC